MTNDGLRACADALEQGKAVVFPTDTVYGIGVSVHHAKSPQVLFNIKQRAAGKPIAWLVGSPEALDEYGCDVSERAKELARFHWPGALTIIVKASDAVPPVFRSQGGTIGLRMPANETALELIDAVGGPLATSSANISGGPDPRCFADIDDELLARVAASVEDGQPCSGVASTVIDCSGQDVIIVRQGDVVV